MFHYRLVSFLEWYFRPLAGARSALLALLAFLPMASHVFLGGFGVGSERRVGTCDAVDRLPLSSCSATVCAGDGGQLPLGGKTIPCCCGGSACCCSCISSSCSYSSGRLGVSLCWSHCCNVMVSHRFLALRSTFGVHCSGFRADPMCILVLWINIILLQCTLLACFPLVVMSPSTRSLPV